MRVWCMVFGCVVCAASLGAQAPPPAAVFKSGVDLVALNVVVTDSRRKFVTGLEASDFSVFEDGVQQNISFFAATGLPLDLALLLDTSASMGDKIGTVQQAAIGFASTLRQGDQIAVVDIKGKVSTLHSLDGDVAAAIQAIRSTRASGNTAVYNGLYITLKDLAAQRKASSEARRQAIALLTDGEDTVSLVSFDDVLELAKRSGIAIYTIVLKPPRVGFPDSTGSWFFSQSGFAMKALAQESGARFFAPVEIRELAGIYDVIADELANQYAIGYLPKNPKYDGSYRHVTVRVDRPDARARARSGYLAARTSIDPYAP